MAQEMNGELLPPPGDARSSKKLPTVKTGFKSKIDGRNESVQAYEAMLFYADCLERFPEEKRERIFERVAEKFDQATRTIELWYGRFEWPRRSKEVMVARKTGARTDVQLRVDQLYNNIEILTRLGTRVLQEYFINLDSKTLTPKDASQLGEMVIKAAELGVGLFGARGSQPGSTNINSGVTLVIKH